MNTQALEKFTILVKDVPWKEVKKGIDYLRANDIKVIKRKDDLWESRDFLEVYEGNVGFEYFLKREEDRELLTLPNDWDKLVAYVEEYKRDNEINPVPALRSFKKAIVNLQPKPKPLFTNSLGDEFFKGDIFWWGDFQFFKCRSYAVVQEHTQFNSNAFGTEIFKTEAQAKEALLKHECPNYQELIDNGIIKLC